MRALTLILLLLLPVPALAQGRVLAEYTARIGPQDHVTSQGVRLDTAAAVLRQDRANYHRFDNADPEDEGDDVFDDAHERARFERLLSRGIARPQTLRAIVNATPLVRVTVYATRADVELIQD
jgi:hypothetical protein